MPVRKTAAAKVAKPAVVLEGEVMAQADEPPTTDGGEPLVLVEFAPDLMIWMRKINPSQFAVLADEAARARKNPDQALRVIEVFFLIIESLIPDQADVLRLRDAIALRQATIETIIPALEREEAGAPTTGPAKRTRRGR
jgi:hypothetical protein